MLICNYMWEQKNYFPRSYIKVEHKNTHAVNSFSKNLNLKMKWTFIYTHCIKRNLDSHAKRCFKPNGVVQLILYYLVDVYYVCIRHLKRSHSRSHFSHSYKQWEIFCYHFYWDTRKWNQIEYCMAKMVEE